MRSAEMYRLCKWLESKYDILKPLVIIWVQNAVQNNGAVIFRAINSSVSYQSQNYMCTYCNLDIISIFSICPFDTNSVRTFAD